jgi:hypothetical protein
MRRGIIIAVLFTLFIWACGNSEQDGFLEVEELVGEVVSEVNEVNTPGVYLQVVDTFLVVFRQNEPFFQVYSTNSHHLLSEFGERGNGPDQFIFPNYFHYKSENSDPIYAISDVGKMRLTYVDLIKLVKGDNEYLTHSDLSNLNGTLRVLVAQDGIIIGEEEQNTYEPKHRFFIYDEVNNIKTKVPYLPVNELGLEGLDLYLSYYSLIAYNQEKQLIAALPQNLGQVDYFSTKGEWLYSNTFDTPSSPNRIKSVDKSEESTQSFVAGKTYFYGFAATDKYIFGHSVEEVNSNALEFKAPSILIRVFDWEGNQKAIFRIDGDDETYFTYDSNHNRFYIYHASRETNNLMMYEVPPLD